jgi:uncharacterized repeat protein (TIGR01451 family)
MTMRKRAIASLLLVLAILPSMGGLAFANHSGAPVIIGGFEVDGNMADDLPGATVDWANNHAALQGDYFDGDAVPTIVDDIYKGGSKDHLPGGWQFVDQSVPGKDDLTRIYAKAVISGPTQGFLYLAFERLGVQGDGDVHVDFELNKSGAGLTNYPGEASIGGTVALPTRAAGDLRIAYDYSGGSGPVSIKVFQWTGSATVGSWVPASPGPNAAAGDINSGTIVRSLSDPRFPTQTIEDRRFGELAVDLPAVFGAGFIGCPGFATVYAKSRSSGESETATLKDVVMPVPLSVSTCGSIQVNKVDDLGAPLAGATFGLYKDTGVLGVFVQGVDPEVKTCTTGGTGTCTFTEVDPAFQYFVKEKSAPAGYSIDPFLAGPLTVVTGQTLAVSHTFVDPLDLGSLRITKRDSLNNLVSGVRFILYTDTDADGSFDAGEQATTRAGLPAECITVAGVCTITGLVPGTYRVHEDPTTVPPTMGVDSDKNVTIVASTTQNVLFTNPVKPSDIHIVKSGPATAHVGDTITYTLDVSIPASGEIPLSSVVVSDPKCIAAPVLLSKDGGDLDAILELGEVWHYSCQHTVTAADGDPLHNVATATGVDAFGRIPQDTDAHDVDILHPGINIVKDGPAFAHVGDTVTYTFTVTNTGDTALANVVLTDAKCGSTPVLTGGDTNTDTKLGLSETWTFTCTHLVTNADATDGDGTTLHNTAAVSGRSIIPNGSTVTVQDDASHDLTILLPAIAVLKTADVDVVHVGDTVTYTFTVTNVSVPGAQTPLSNVTVSDDLCAPAVYQSGDTNNNSILESTETWTFTCARVVLVDDPTPLPNTVTAEADSVINGGSTQHVSSQDDDLVNILRPAIGISKAGSATQAHVGDTVIYTLTVTNAGTSSPKTPLSNVVVTDTRCDSDPVLVSKSGGDNDDLLEGAEVWTYTCSHEVEASDAPSILNVASAEGQDDLGTIVHDQDDFTVAVLAPRINIVKSGPTLAHVGDNVTYTLVVTNIGNTPLSDIDVTDPKCDSAPELQSKVGGDNDSSLELGEIWTYTCTHVVTGGDGTQIVNTATAEGTDALDLTVDDSDSHRVDIIVPVILIEKDGPAEAHVGDVITYTLTVTNEGNTPLSGVLVTDDQCDSAPILTGGDLDTDGVLGLDEAWTYTCTHTVLDTDADPLPNTATAAGTDVLGATVDSEDSHSVDILHPSIEVVKSSSVDSGNPGDTVIYTYEVTNTSEDTTLFDVVVTDDILGVIGTIDVLEPGETVVLTSDPYTLGASAVTNVVVAEGRDNLGKVVDDDDTVTVLVVLPLPPIRLPKTGTGLGGFMVTGWSFLVSGSAMTILSRKRKAAKA